MYVAEIHFNHDPASASHDAINIRRNATGGPIVAPEWNVGSDPQATAYARTAISGPVAVLVRLRDGPRNGGAWVRAVDVQSLTASRPGCLSMAADFAVKWLHVLLGNVLGDVSARFVTFDEYGDSGLVMIHLLNHKLATALVGRHLTQWAWQSRPEGSSPLSGWQNFDHTTHRIYTLLDMPRDPWNQDASFNNKQLPWSDALEKACLWALGADDVVTAAAKITRAINGQRSQKYWGMTSFATGGWYRLAEYLQQLDHATLFYMNCTDCADAVTTFSNLLGCDLWAGQFFDMVTRPVMALYGDPTSPYDWDTHTWLYHEIAWQSAIGLNQPVYDACVTLDLDQNDTDQVHVPELATGMQFGGSPPLDYRTLLIASGDGELEGTPRRRSVM